MKNGWDMPAKTHGDERLHKTWKRQTRIFLALVVFGAIVLSAAVPANAEGTPSKVITFTDKKVYTAWWMSRSTGAPAFNTLESAVSGEVEPVIYIYAFVLDDDGNIMKGRTVQVTLNDTDFDHYEKNDWTNHSAIVGNNTYFTGSKNLNDTGTFGDMNANDGLYTTTVNMNSSLMTAVATSPRMDDHIRIKIDVKDTASGLNDTAYVLVSWGICHQTPNSHPSQHLSTSTTSDLCTVCHGGYEHFFENVSGTIPDQYLDVHFKRLGNSLPDSTMLVQGTLAKTYWAHYNWNSSTSNAVTADISWKNRSAGAAVFCLFCHENPAGGWFDYGSLAGGDRSNMASKPSCGQGTSAYSGSCHSTTDIEGAPVLNWTANMAIATTNDTLQGINNQQSHNLSTRGANVSCSLCHGGPHGLTRPNPTTNNLTLICKTCHNISDAWVNNTRYNENQSHPKDIACKSCHSTNGKLDAHAVPTGVFGGRWCLDCHRINGKSPIYIDENVVNISNTDYIHNNLNNKSDATNSSRICWACHVNDTLVQNNNTVNSTGIPTTTHPDNYTTPRTCLDCHNKSTGINFSAPQTQRHTWFASTMRTTAVTYCNDCHAQGESLEVYNQSATTPSTDNESVSHYGKERLDLEALVGQKAYCATCHQNESTVFGPFAKESNKVRSDHASQPTTPSCGNATCHRSGALHDANLVKPNFTQSNISSTCLNCHSNTSYNYHNSTLTCWDCHMNDTDVNIHPIQFIQYNGNFTGAKLTGATCYDCHKTNNVDNTTQRLANTKPPKIYSQSHSNDPINGTKWGDYWKYTPTVYQFASYEILGGNGSIDPAHPFSNIQVPSNDYMQLNETQIGRVYDVTLPALTTDRDFTIDPTGGNWTSSTATGGAVGTVSASYDSTTGNPAGSGSLEGMLTTSSTNAQHFGYIWWNYSFYYNPNSSGLKYTNVSVDYSVTVTSATYAQNVYLNIVKPSGAVVTLNSSGAITANTGWKSLTNYSFASALNENGSVTPYKLQLYAVLSGPRTSQVFTVNYDNVNMRIKEKVWNRYEIVINTTGVPVNGSSVLGMAYQVHKENTSLMIYNKTSGAYELLDTLNKGVFYDYTKNISSTYHINSTDGVTGNVSVKMVDTDQSDTDAVSDSMHIRYLYVYTDRGLQYPCEQCHSPNKHYINPTLGSPSKFSAGNLVNQSISSSGTWCQQCHWQGAANYSLMIQEFNKTRNPPENVPPEITGNTTYAPLGGARDGTSYKDHTGFDLTDAGCFSCHGGSLNQNAGMNAFVHGVSEGTSGGANCTNCHDVGQTPPKAGALVNISAMNDSLAIHRNLNSGATSPSGYPSSNFKCWACHGNGSEPTAGNHPSKYNKPYNCTECHVQGAGQNLNFTPQSILNVTQHYWNGSNISTAGVTSCYSCHNRTEMMLGLALDPDGAASVYGGANGGNNSTSHYGKKRSDMASWDTITYCTYCHNTTTNNATFYVSDFNNTIFNHTSRATTPLCTTCHYNGRIHNSTLAKPVSNDSYCSTCHGTGGTAATNNKSEHKTLYCTECHANNSAGNLSGKDIHAIKYLTQSNTFSTSNSSAVSCVTCHQTSSVDSSLNGFTAFKIVNPMRHSDNLSNGSVWDSYWTNTTPQTACIYCHSDTKHNATPLGRILQWSSGYKMYGGIGSNASCSDCHYQGDSNYSQMSSAFVTAGLRTPPEITNGTSWKGNSSNYYNHSLAAYDDSTCKSCHGALLSASANMSEFMHNAATGVNGGANCTACHNIGGSAGAGKLVNFSAMNDSNAIHRNLNSGTTNSSNATAENKKCWACHGNGSEPSGHPSNYKTPYNCTNCHVQGAGQNFNYTPNSTVLNVTQHYWNGTSINTTNATSCYACHNKSEMMVSVTPDPDGAAGVYGGTNGGNNSTSHYGRKRTDYPQQDTIAYCNKCHNNGTSVFPFIDPANKTIANHSMNYNSTNPSCSESNCHATGRIHNSTIYKPAFALPNSTYCLACHGTPGSINATKKNLERHNDTTGLNCTQCHLNSSQSIHPVRYLQQGGSTWSTSNASAVNCTSCHQGTGLGGSFSNAPRVPAPMNHSANSYSGALWNNTQPAYWTNTSQQSSCDYCHGKISLHNNSGLGNITRVKGSNKVRQDLDASRWCANCHYAGAQNYAGASFSPEPPEITNATGKVPSKARDNTNFYNHSQDMATGYNDTKCKSCHNNALDANATSLNFSHNLAPGGGGANCTGCHFIGAGVQNINITAVNAADSIHKDLNKGATASDYGFNDSKKCWACHSDDGKEPSGHPARYKTPYNCTNCHVQGGGQNFNYTPAAVLNVTQHYWNGNSIRTPNATSCYACHNTSGMITLAYDPDGASSNVYGGANGGNDSVSHYGKKRSDMALQQNTTPYCDNCHNGSSSFPFIDSANRTIANHSLNYPATNPTCKDCHSGGRIHNGTLYKTSLSPLPNATYCTGCHGAGGSAGKNNLERHNSTGTSCSQCHLNTSRNIHPVNYLQQDNSWATTKASAVNCTSCHQGSGLSGFDSAPRVPALNHSTNSYSGALWNNTQPAYWTNTSQQSSCDYCHGKFSLHNLSGLGNITIVKGSNNVRQGFTGGYWCANCHYSGSTNYSGNKFSPQPPEVLNTSGLVPAFARDNTQFYNHSGDLASSYDDAKCKTCHNNNLGVSATSLNFTHSLGASSGGANCTSCHGLGGTLSDGKRINQTAMNSSIHKDLNKDATTSDANYSESRKCWACHGDGTEPGGHPARYKTPYNCVDCHVPGAGQNFNYAPNNTVLSVTQHFWNGTSINTTNASSCYACHNKSEMMAGMTLDPDGAATVYSGANGGNLSVSHYGKKRGDMAAMTNTTYCNYCHNNVSSVFPFVNNSNKTIANHSMNYAASNPACADCHASGRLHNNTIYKPAFDMSNVTYCLSCHGNNGAGGTNYSGAVTGYKEKHNNSLCIECHLNSSLGIHPVRYLQQDSNWSTTNSSAVNCTTCHQGSGMSSFGSAFLVQTPIWHSNNSYSGALWNGTQQRFWDNTSQQSSCDYCHGKAALHNTSGLGKSALVRGSNSKNQSLTGGYWCANCHYNGSPPSGNYNYKGNLFNPVPPEQLNLTGMVPANSSDGTPFQNHSINSAGDWSDVRCKSCHGKDLPSNTASATFLHMLNKSQPDAGGPDCLKCHPSTAPTGSDRPPLNKRINATAFTNYSVHKDLNKNAISTITLTDNRSKSCWACHGDGTQPINHPADYLNPKSCDYCHVNGNFNATPVGKHYPGSVFSGQLIHSTNYTEGSCQVCHNNSIVYNNITASLNATISHYAGNSSYGLQQTNISSSCADCHASSTTPYGKPRQLTDQIKHSMNGACQASCHNPYYYNATNVNPINLHNASLGIYYDCYKGGCHVQVVRTGRGGTR